jgi:hypothetical protein
MVFSCPPNRQRLPRPGAPAVGGYADSSRNRGGCCRSGRVVARPCGGTNRFPVRLPSRGSWVRRGTPSPAADLLTTIDGCAGIGISLPVGPLRLGAFGLEGTATRRSQAFLRDGFRWKRDDSRHRCRLCSRGTSGGCPDRGVLSQRHLDGGARGGAVGRVSPGAPPPPHPANGRPVSGLLAPRPVRRLPMTDSICPGSSGPAGG